MVRTLLEDAEARNFSSEEKARAIILSFWFLNTLITYLVYKFHKMTGASCVFDVLDPCYPVAIYFPKISNKINLPWFERATAVIASSCPLRKAWSLLSFIFSIII
jgi:hypothetical protein